MLTEKKSERQEKEEEMLGSCRLQPLLFGVWMLRRDVQIEIHIMWRFSEKDTAMRLRSHV